MARKSIFKLHSLLNYFKDDTKLIKRGENAMESNYVKSLTYQEERNLLIGCVEASMKDKVYTVEVSTDDNGEIKVAKCQCPRRKVRCHHMAALLLYAHHNVSVTDKACNWSHRTEIKEQETKTVAELFPNKKCKASKDDHGNEGHLEAEILDELDKLDTIVGYIWLLSPEPQTSDNVKYITLDYILFSQQFRVSSNKGDFLLTNSKLNDDAIKEIANDTIGQSSNLKWGAYRNFCITASNFGIVLRQCKRNKITPSTFKKLVGSYQLDGVRAIQWGRQYEKDAIEVFEKQFHDKVEKTGIWLHSSGLLGASPDGLVEDLNGKAVVEVKCPFKYRNCLLCWDCNVFVCTLLANTNEF